MLQKKSLRDYITLNTIDTVSENIVKYIADYRYNNLITGLSRVEFYISIEVVKENLMCLLPLNTFNKKLITDFLLYKNPRVLESTTSTEELSSFIFEYLDSKCLQVVDDSLDEEIKPITGRLVVY